ncbi:MAG: hypothetical protein NXI13_16435 [Proteobacteria bacterium]|nr:hypothetical protein [Pseudomonadota bacterium]
MSFFDFVTSDTFLDLAGTAISAGSSIYNNNQAVNAQTGAANQAAQLTADQFQQQREDLAPWMGVGRNALYATSALSGIAAPDLTPQQNQQVYQNAITNFQAYPGYQWRVDQGIQALDRSAASRGRLQSGAQQKAITDFGQNAASIEYGNYVNQLNNLAGIGQLTTSQVNQAGANAAANQGNAILQGGNARASGYQNQSGIINNALQNLLTVN